MARICITYNIVMRYCATNSNRRFKPVETSWLLKSVSRSHRMKLRLIHNLRSCKLRKFSSVLRRCQAGMGNGENSPALPSRIMKVPLDVNVIGFSPRVRKRAHGRHPDARSIFMHSANICAAIIPRRSTDVATSEQDPFRGNRENRSEGIVFTDVEPATQRQI